MPAINNNLSAASIVTDILRTNSLEQTGLISKSEARNDVGHMIGALIASEDVTPADVATANEVLDRLTREETRSSGSSSGIFGKLKQIASDFRGTSPTFGKVAAPTVREAIAQLKADAQLATLPYSGVLPEGSTVDRVATSALAMQVDFHMRNDHSKGGLVNDGDPARLGQFVDRKSGLTANVVVDPTNKSVKVIFGGTTAGLTQSDSFFKRSSGNFVSTLSQWVTNVKSGLGLQSHSLQQAKNLTAKVLDVVRNDPAFKDYTVSTIGHSKGASEAVYAALSANPPLKAVGFSSADLGGKLVRGLPQENVARAKELVSHFHVKADSVPNLRYATPSMRPLGQEAVIPASGVAGPLGRHDEFARHISSWADRQLAHA